MSESSENAQSPAVASFWKRILPRTILGLASLLFFMSIAAAFSGAALFAYYRFELDETRQRVVEVESSIADQVEAGQQIIDADTAEATTEIEALLDELEQFAASGQTLDELLDGVRESVYLVSTLDENGQASVGTAFVLFSDSERSFLLTSYTTVRAATADPGPGVTVRRDGEEIGVQLSSWDPGRDLALLVAEDAPNLPPVKIADPSSVTSGDRAFAVSGLGSGGASIVQGTLVDVAANAITHDVPIGPQFQGGPMLNSNGRAHRHLVAGLRPVGVPGRCRLLRRSRVGSVCRGRAVSRRPHRLNSVSRRRRTGPSTEPSWSSTWSSSCCWSWSTSSWSAPARPAVPDRRRTVRHCRSTRSPTEHRGRTRAARAAVLRWRPP
ncbi:S1 family peptidase [Actinospongicola halichondriae]|uniref:S1 family peptidase n=1 Tax=Actinospongicola halichondriae TaxID=3236844 RepID=UPI003D40E37E